jgi:DMSO/TMAO reductase YedYZ molybdopterin-dependent catalytic subunit
LLINTFDATPQLDPQQFRLKVGGEVAYPLSLSLAEIEKMPLTTMTIRHICVEGWSAIVQWAGIQLRELVKRVQPTSTVRYVYFKSADGYYESWDLDSVLHPQTLLAYQKNGQPLPLENGAPLRLASPIKLGYKQSKWITQISFLSNKPKMLGYWEDQGYEWYAGI